MIEEHWLVNAVGRAVASLDRREIAIDVGANVGEWTRELSGIFSSVLAFEPDPRARRQIQAASNVTVSDSAVRHECGQAMLHLRKDPGKNSLLEVHPIGGDSQAAAPVVESVMTKCVTLDSVAEQGADFVKIDVEGAEVDVLFGCQDVARWRRTVFVVECHDTRAAVVEQLWRLGKAVRLVRHPIATAHPGHCWLIGVQ